MDTKQELPVLPFSSPPEWETWLAAHHLTAKGLWLKLAKRDTGIDTVTYAEALDIALCYGWIDGHKRPLDDTWWLQKFTPRAARSKWSKINRAKALALIESGRMQPAGLAQIEQAQSDGRSWRCSTGARSCTRRARDGLLQFQERP
ncbi:MAG: hypothetical protein ABUL63_02300 [Acidobacteriota bacterium]